jgi:hypothetical protein
MRPARTSASSSGMVANVMATLYREVRPGMAAS